MTTETKETYSGWTNYETWNVKLWIDNEEGDYDYWNEQARECYDEEEADTYSTKEESAVYELAGRLKSFFEENTPTVTGCYADLLNGALSEVNWHEIAQAIVDDAVEKEEQPIES